MSPRRDGRSGGEDPGGDPAYPDREDPDTAATILLDPPREIPAGELEFTRRFIAACPFTHAKTVPDSPHEHCLRAWIAEDRQDDYPPSSPSSTSTATGAASSRPPVAT